MHRFIVIKTKVKTIDVINENNEIELDTIIKESSYLFLKIIWMLKKEKNLKLVDKIATLN